MSNEKELLTSKEKELQETTRILTGNLEELETALSTVRRLI